MHSFSHKGVCLSEVAKKFEIFWVNSVQFAHEGASFVDISETWE